MRAIDLSLVVFLFGSGAAGLARADLVPDPPPDAGAAKAADAGGIKPTALDLDSGHKLFASKCAGCHGADGKGLTKFGKTHHVPDLSSPAWQDKTTELKIRETIVNGVTAADGGKRLMPAFGTKLSEGDIVQVAGFVRTLRPQ